MRIVMTGHAGLYVEANGRTLLCDPWFNAAYFGSWFPFPDNGSLDLDELSSPDYLYVSHLHKDHFDAQFLAEHVDKDTTVLLPDFPIDDLRRAMEDLGFTRFVETQSGRPVDLDGLRVAIATSTSVADGPIGDSALIVDDGVTRILNQNDCHPRELSPFRALGPYDVHFLQYSGAIWYPMVYRWSDEEKEALSREKRVRQAQRALHYIQAIGAAHVIPFAGPPAFLDDALFSLNDLDDDPTNIFQDQRSFLQWLAAQGLSQGHLAIAGSAIEVGPDHFEVTHRMSTEELDAVFGDKRAYLAAYKERRQPEIAEALPDPATGSVDPDEIVGRLSSWIEPLLAHAPTVRQALGGTILLDVGRFGVVIDPEAGQVRRAQPGDESSAGHSFFFDEALLLSLVDRHVEDWVNEFFLSCRFEADRQGEYNENVFSFFKCLAPRRMEYLEVSLALVARSAEAGVGGGPGELLRCGDYLVQRRCPHLGADLSRFGHVEDDVLTCALHGNRYDLRTGQCLSAEGLDLFTVPVDTVDQVDGGSAGQVEVAVPGSVDRSGLRSASDADLAAGSPGPRAGDRPGGGAASVEAVETVEAT
jgi:UDP-MurNAc hydroxylase